jgi:hypothetical protein
MIFIGEEREGEIVLLLELRLLLDRVRGVAEYDCIQSLEPRESVAERARFDGSTRGVGFRIEVEHDPVAAVVAQRDLFPLVGFDREVWSG